MTAEELKAIRDRLRIYGLAACADEEMVSALLDEVERLRRLRKQRRPSMGASLRLRLTNGIPPDPPPPSSPSPYSRREGRGDAST
jgi:hypothetical protein